MRKKKSNHFEIETGKRRPAGGKWQDTWFYRHRSANNKITLPSESYNKLASAVNAIESVLGDMKSHALLRIDIIEKKVITGTLIWIPRCYAHLINSNAEPAYKYHYRDLSLGAIYKVSDAPRICDGAGGLLID